MEGNSWVATYLWLIDWLIAHPKSIFNQNQVFVQAYICDMYLQILLANFILCLAHARCSQTSVITDILLRNTEETNQYFYGPFPNLWFWLPAQVTVRNHQWCLPEQKIMNLRHETSWLNHHSGFVVGCFLQTKISNVHPPATMAKYRSCLLINRLKYYRFNALHERRVKQRGNPSQSFSSTFTQVYFLLDHAPDETTRVWHL